MMMWSLNKSTGLKLATILHKIMATIFYKIETLFVSHFFCSTTQKMKIVSWIDEKYINWKVLSENTCPQAIQLLRENPDKIYWEGLSLNSCPQAIQLLRENPDKINWFWLSSNSSPEAIQLLCENPDKIDWQNLNLSSLEALMLLLEHPEKIDKVNSFRLFQNHHIFDDDVVIK